MSKITYQKSRMVVILVFTIILESFNLLSGVFFGPSEFELGQRYSKSMIVFFMLIAIIVFRQKYEVQIV